MRLKEIKPGMIIHCKTEEEAKALHAELCRLGNMSTDLDALLNFINIKNLYYAILDLNAKTWRFSNEYEFETRNGIEFSDLIIPELSAKEVLETMKEIYGWLLFVAILCLTVLFSNVLMIAEDLLFVMTRASWTWIVRAQKLNAA